MTTGGTRLCCLLGDPVEHSLSPRIFSAAFSATGVDCAYLAFRVRKDDLKIALDGLRAMGFMGCNVTMPHKIEVAKCVTRLEGTAGLVGSVNVISNQDGELVGSNTDGLGALVSLETNGVTLDGRRILLIGYGGVGRAVAFEVAKARRPAELMITGRDLAKASELARELGAFAKARALSLENMESADVIINATPVGMYPLVDELPLPESVLQPGTTVFDLVYHPLETKLLRLSSKKGCKTINGLEMLLQQGALTFEIWTGLKPPLREMRKAAMGGLA